MNYSSWLRAIITFVVVFCLLQYATTEHAIQIKITEGQIAVVAFCIYLLFRSAYLIGSWSRQEEINYLRAVLSNRGAGP